MSKKDYVYAAKWMAEHRMVITTDAWVEFLDFLCGMFANDNLNFDEERFRNACHS